jgi:predicted nuclease of predicted toxin-antitoxin system
MNFLLDENFPKAVISYLEELGHAVYDFRLLGEEGSPDSWVIKMAIERSAMVLSTDRDFFHTLGRQFPDHFGILVIALKKPSRVAIVDKLVWFIEKFGALDLMGRSFQLRDRAWMVYPPFKD